MTLIPTWLTSKRAGPIATALSVILLLVAIEQHAGRRTAELRVAKLQALIDNPVMGWKARLGACEADVTSLDASLTAQSAATAALEADEKPARTAVRRAPVDGRMARLLQPAVGGDACIRLLDIDRRVTETLK
jgi:hypothetical protein